MATEVKRAYVYITDNCLDARDIEFKGVPETVEVCRLCDGNGKRVQYYLEGKSTGICECCNGMGFVYKHTDKPVSESVVNQIAVASRLSFRHYSSHGLDWKRA